MPPDHGSLGCYPVTSFERDSLDNLRQQLWKKVKKRHFGPDTALVMRSTSPLDWDWGLYEDEIRQILADVLREHDMAQQPYDRGIWIVAHEESGAKLYPVAPEHGQASSD